MRGEAKRWFSEALWDLDTARILYREKRFNAAVFYAHQAAGKAVKALLYSINESPWGHSIRDLLMRYYRSKGVDINEEILSYARELDIHYIPSRYPNAHPRGTPHEAYDERIASNALKASEKIVDYIGRLLGFERE